MRGVAASGPSPNGEPPRYAIDREHATETILRAFAAAMRAPTAALLESVRTPLLDHKELVLRGLLTTSQSGDRAHVRIGRDGAGETRLIAPPTSVLGTALFADEPVVGRVAHFADSDPRVASWWVVAVGVGPPAGERGVLYAKREGRPADADDLRALSRAFAASASLCLLAPALSERERVAAVRRALREARRLASLAGPALNGEDPFGALIREMGSRRASSSAVDPAAAPRREGSPG
jgi:hypothetical protein